MSIADSAPLWRPTELPIDPNDVADVGFERMRVTSPYGWRRNPLKQPGDNRPDTVWHDGLDIGNARLGDVVTADRDAIVVVAGTPGWPWSEPTTRYPEGNYGGRMVVLEADWLSVYAHLDTITVEEGEPVRMGDQVGTVGATGAARDGGAHLHYAHVMLPAAEVYRLGRIDGQRHTRNPWPRIDAVGELPPREETPLERERRLAAEVIDLRAKYPRAWRRWEAATHMNQQLDGKPLTRMDRLAATALYLRTNPLSEA